MCAGVCSQQEPAVINKLRSLAAGVLVPLTTCNGGTVGGRGTGIIREALACAVDFAVPRINILLAAQDYDRDIIRAVILELDCVVGCARWNSQHQQGTKETYGKKFHPILFYEIF